METMKTKIFRSVLLAVVLCGLIGLGAGCSDEFGKLQPDSEPSPFQVTATIPHHQQVNVPLSSGIIIHFSEPVDPISVSDRVVLTDDSGQPAAFRAEVQGKSIVLFPEGLWKAGTEYSLTVEPGILSLTDREMTDVRRVNFRTGVRRPIDALPLAVDQAIPGPDDPCWDFQTFRILFNEPIDRTTLQYGVSVLFTDDATGDLVPGNVFARGNQIAFDPDQDLTAGQSYTLTVNSNLRDYSNEGVLEEFNISYVPISTGNRPTLAMDNCPTVMEGTAFCEALPQGSLFPKSSFIDRDINSMYANSLLLGPTNIQIGARLWSEFGEGRLSPNRVPFVVRKGQQIYGLGLESKVGGEIDTGVDSGPITITVMTDAMGELVGSEFVHGVAGLPATILFTMDAAMVTSSKAGSAVLGQPILGVNMVGQAKVSEVDGVPDYEAMEIEVVGFTEVELISEYVPVTMAMKMVPPPIKPEPTPDSEPPKVRTVSPVDFTTTPEDITDWVQTRMAGDEIIVTFSEPVDPDSVRGNIVLIGPSGEVPGKYDIYNPKAAFIPNRPLEPNTTYTVEVIEGIEDLSGNRLETTERFQFRTMAAQSSPVDAPLICATVPGNFAGATLPSNFYPEVYFSQIIDKDSLVYGDTLALYDEDNGGVLLPGVLVYRSVFVQFVPDQYLDLNGRYRWVITSDIRNIDGVELDTDADREPGGPDRVIEFKATVFSPFVQTMLLTYPYGDANVNGYMDGDETATVVNYMEMDFSLVHERSYTMGYFPITIHGLITDAQGQPRLPIDIEPTAMIYASSVKLGLGEQIADPPELLEMGRVFIEVRAPASADLFTAPDGLVGVDADTQMLFNVENQMINGFLEHEAEFKIPSKLRLTNDGRMIVIIEGGTAISMDVPIIGPQEIPVSTLMLTTTIPSPRGF